jgi:sugar phosphate isomerase/epimerase
MLIGAMNNPARDLMSEIAWMAEMELDFIDLTLEPPLAAVWAINPREIAAALSANGLRVVGHTAYYLPMCSPFESLRRATVEELKRCLDVFALLGAVWMNLHPDRHAPLHERSVVIERNLLTLRELVPAARDCGVRLMIENLPGSFNTVAQLSELLDPMPELGLHLDIGHCNLMVEENTADSIIAAYGSRLAHVHLHDNKGGSADLHLPLGTGTVNAAHHVRTLRSYGYDSTITLEVFSPDQRHLAYSRDVLRQMWDQSVVETEPAVLV